MTNDATHKRWRTFLGTIDAAAADIAPERLNKLQNRILDMTIPRHAAHACGAGTTALVFGKRDLFQWSTAMIMACLCGMLLGHTTQYGQTRTMESTQTAQAYMASYSAWDHYIH